MSAAPVAPLRTRIEALHRFAGSLSAGHTPALQAALLLTAALCIVLRNPIYFSDARFWAEEGRYFFASAWNQGFFERLFDPAVVPHAPYFIPFPHLVTLMAAYLVPLEFAPLFTTLMSMMLMVAVAAVIVGSEARLLNSWPRRVLALTIFLVAPSSAEIWLNTLGASYYSLVAAVVLLLGARTAVGAARRANLVLFAIFCFLSPLCAVLLPAVAWLCWRAWAAHRGHLAVLLAAVALQAIAHLASPHEVTAARTTLPGLATLGHWITASHVMLPFLGWQTAEAYAALAFGLDPAGFQVLGALAALAVATALVLLVAAGRRDETTGVLLLALLGVLAAVVGLGLGDKRLLIPPGQGERYTWLPNCLLLLLLMHQVDAPGLRSLRLRPLLASGMLALALLHAAPLFARFTIASRDWPVWRVEVERWRQDPQARPLASWPAEVPGAWDVPLRPR